MAYGALLTSGDTDLSGVFEIRYMLKSRLRNAILGYLVHAR